MLGRYERELNEHVAAHHPALLTDIAKKKDLDDDLEKRMKAMLDEFNAKFDPKG